MHWRWIEKNDLEAKDENIYVSSNPIKWNGRNRGNEKTYTMYHPIKWNGRNRGNEKTYTNWLKVWFLSRKPDLRCLHRVMLRKVNLQLVGLAGVKSARGSGDLNYPPVQLSRENYPISRVVQIHHRERLRSKKSPRYQEQISTTGEGSWTVEPIHLEDGKKAKEKKNPLHK